MRAPLTDTVKRRNRSVSSLEEDLVMDTGFSPSSTRMIGPTMCLKSYRHRHLLHNHNHNVEGEAGLQ